MAPHAAARIAGLLLLLLASPAESARSSVAVRGNKAPKGTTPVKKVIELLKSLSAKVEEEGKKEAAAYDKFACFCKEQADQKLYAIEKSESLMSELTAESSELQSELTALSTGISTLSGTISNLESEIQNATGVRNTEHETYLGREADTSGAISALKRAIASIKESKGQMGGKVALEAALPQLHAAAGRTTLSSAQRKLLAAMAKGSKPGEAYDYEFHSNDILATLNSLLVTFKETKERLDLEEFQAQSEFEKRKLGLENEKAFAEKEKLEKEKLEAAKTERRQAAQAELLAETGARDADQEFMRELTTQCQDKATEWDTRSQTRSQEITAISKALEALETGVAPNWKANRMLVGLQKAKAKEQAPSFLQLRGSGQNLRASGAKAVQQKVLALIGGAASRLRSPALSVAALKVKASEDHFEKVRSIIKDIVARLEAQAAAESTTKSFCDTEMSAAVSSRDAKAEEVESLEGQITAKEARKAELLGEIAALAKGIAENAKALEEATELRTEESRDNNGVMADSVAGKEAVEYALQVLEDFYESQGTTLLQGGYVPPKSDRSGKTVGDLAPETFESGYEGAQEASKGIIGMLEVILSDFDRTNTTVGAQETFAEGEFQNFKSALEGDTSSKELDKSNKEGEVTNIEDDLVTLTDSKRDAVRDKELAESELEGLRSMCVEGEETYEERVAKREKEIAALKEAHAILENWQS